MNNQEKLDNAMAEIKAILEKNDIAGVVVLHAQKYIQYATRLDPSYSCARTVGKEFHFDLDVKHFKGDVKKQTEVVYDTADMFSAVADNLAGLWFVIQDASLTLDKALDITRPVAKYQPQKS